MAKTPSSLTHLSRHVYRLANTLGEWLQDVTRTTATLVEEAHGAVGRLYDARLGRTVGEYALHLANAEVRSSLMAHRANTADRIDFLSIGGTGFRSVRQIADASSDPYLRGMERRFTAAGVHDMIHLTAHDGAGLWVTVGLLLRGPLRTPWTDQSARVAHLHLTRALRLQRHASNLATRLVGRPHDPTRDALRAVVRRLDATQKGLDRARALEIWTGVLDGSWSLVDRHDHEGRRYLVAQRETPEHWGQPCLSPRQAHVAALAAEGYSDKWIAFTLGLDRSTVASHLATALERLQLGSRAALARAFRLRP